MTVKIEDIDCVPITMDEAKITIRQLLMVLLETQNVAIERGNKLIEANERLLAIALNGEISWSIASKEAPKKIIQEL